MKEYENVIDVQACELGMCGASLLNTDVTEGTATASVTVVLVLTF
jgi:hypothetical protein